MTMTAGKWTCSTDEEDWSCAEEFDTRDEAIAHARAVLCPESNYEDGMSFYTGRIVAIDLAGMAARACHAESAIDAMSEWLYEHVGEHAHDALHATKVQQDDLDARLTKTVTDWMAEHAITPNCFSVERIEDATWHQCKETRAGDGPVPEHCLIHLEHEGVHEWL